jgi:hypothetical protein
VLAVEARRRRELLVPWWGCRRSIDVKERRIDVDAAFGRRMNIEGHRH